MSPTKKKFDEICFAVEECFKAMGVPTLQTEVNAIGKRLLEYHGIELFRLLYAIPGKEKYMPSGAELEFQIRETLGLKNMRGLSAAQIAKNERDLVVAGQAPALAAAGAEMMRKTLRKELPSAQEAHETANEMFQHAAELMGATTPGMPIGPLEVSLGDFDDEDDPLGDF